MKQKLLILSTLFLCGHPVLAQTRIGIGTQAPHGSAVLDVFSQSKGLLIPRMTTDERDAIISPAEGLEIFSTTSKTKYFFDGTTWQTRGPGISNIYYQIYSFGSPVSTGSQQNAINMSPVAQEFISNTAAYAEIDGVNAIKILENGLYVIDLAGTISSIGSNDGPITGRYILRKNGNAVASCFESIGQGYGSNFRTVSVGVTFPPISLVNGDKLTVWGQNVDGSAQGFSLLFQNTTLSITRLLNN